MPCRLQIQLNEQYRTIIEQQPDPNAPPSDDPEAPVPTIPVEVDGGWRAALKACAEEFETIINPALVSMERKAIKVNSQAVNVEDFLGDANTPPTESDNWEEAGLVQVAVAEYDWINSRFFAMLPTPPVTFWLVGGNPPTGAIS